MKYLLFLLFSVLLQPQPKPRKYACTIEYWNMGHKEARAFQIITKDTTYFSTDTLTWRPFPYTVMYFKLDGEPPRKLHQ